MQHARTRISASLLLLLSACDIKLIEGPQDSGDSESYGTEGPPESADGGDGNSHSTGEGPESADGEGGSYPGPYPVPTTSDDPPHPCSASDSGDSEGPVTSTSGGGEETGSGDTETPVSSTTLYPGETETDGGGSDGHSTGINEEACGWGAGGNEDGTWCAFSLTCEGQPERAMQCDTVTCVCLVGGVAVGSCDADEVCLDLGQVQDRAPGCCGFPQVEQ